MVLRGVRVIGDGVCVMGAPVCRAGAGVIAGDGVVAANGLWPGRAGVPPEYDPSAYCSPELGVSGVVRPHTVASERASSVALWKRVSGSRPSARRSQASKPGGNSGTSSDGTGIGAVQSFTSTSPTASPSNGKRPVMQRNAITPTDQRSDR